MGWVEDAAELDRRLGRTPAPAAVAEPEPAPEPVPALTPPREQHSCSACATAAAEGLFAAKAGGVKGASFDDWLRTVNRLAEDVKLPAIVVFDSVSPDGQPQAALYGPSRRPQPGESESSRPPAVAAEMPMQQNGVAPAGAWPAPAPGPSRWQEVSDAWLQTLLAGYKTPAYYKSHLQCDTEGGGRALFKRSDLEHDPAKPRPPGAITVTNVDVAARTVTFEADGERVIVHESDLVRRDEDFPCGVYRRVIPEPSALAKIYGAWHHRRLLLDANRKFYNDFAPPFYNEEALKRLRFEGGDGREPESFTVDGLFVSGLVVQHGATEATGGQE